jgi:glycosyltransferase involved in cell wall biosynthesis
VSAARNRGVQEASADLVAFLDADDLWEPDFLQAIVDLRQRYPSAGLYVTGVGRCFADGRDDHLLSAATPDRGHAVLVDDYLLASQEGSFVTASSVAIPKQVLLDSGGFPVGVAVGEDVDTWVRIGLNYPVACDSRILAFYFTPPARQQVMLAKSKARPITELPVALGNLMRRMAQDEIPAGRRQAVASYIDYSLLAHTDYLLYHGTARELRCFLDQTTACDPAVRSRLSRIRALTSVLPPRLVLALLHRFQAQPGDRAHSAPRYLSHQHSPCRHLNRLP